MSSASDAAVHGSGAGAGAGAGASSARDKPVLIIHVDANETVLFTDEAGGKTQHNIVSEVVAGRAWGKLVLQGDAALADPSVDGSNMLKWELVTTELSDVPPAGYSASDIGKTAGKIILYREYVRKVLYPRIKMTSLEGSELHAALRENNRRKRVWIETFTSFLDKGQAGETLASHRDAAVEALRIPADKADACAAALDELADGYRFLCPAYFNLLLHLRNTGRDYAMTFRTFGTDSARLVDEHNLFCEGRHPLYPGVFMDGTHGSVDRRIHLPRDSGRFYRDDHVIQLCTVNEDNLVDFVVGWESVYYELMRKLRGDEGRMMCIQDYYPYWHRKDRHTNASKPMPIDASDRSIHQIFFDDNIQADRAEIVDVFDVSTMTHMDFSATNNVFMVRARQLDNLGDPDYFIKKVQMCENNRRRAAAGKA